MPEEIPPLEEIRKEIENGQTPRRTVRELLSWFGAKRRGSNVVESVRQSLDKYGLRTDPDFTVTWIDAQVEFHKRPQDDATDQSEPAVIEYIVGMLASANCGVVSVSPNDPLKKAVTLMLRHDFSQLPVMTDGRTLKGAISWKSIARHMSLGNELVEVRHAMDDDAEAIPEKTKLSEATRKVIQKDFVFVHGPDRAIKGIVTATDLAEQFQALSEPFLTIGRIEGLLRRLISGSFDVDDLRAAVAPDDEERASRVNGPSDLTLGELLRLLQKEEHWERVGLSFCRQTFCETLDKVRNTRNEVMHFHPDALERGDHEPLHEMLRLLEALSICRPGE